MDVFYGVNEMEEILLGIVVSEFGICILFRIILEVILFVGIFMN